jgi:hypothetical protein|tara:strand:+ start:1323 stop:1625 length:303 start_codon:yes stop_codon:yes gene_type:complete
MRIPKKVTVGKTDYRIHKVTRMDKVGAMGEIDYDTKDITIAARSSRKPHRKFSKEEMADTFWHEITHAILKDMNSKLHTNESFVAKFANRLTTVISTAKF